MKFILTKLNDFINEELKKLPTSYKFTKSESDDKKHNRLASKEKDGHKWGKSESKKFGKSSTSQKYTCKCGYIKTVVKDEDKNVTITYSQK